jgi:hypothetical protein
MLNVVSKETKTNKVGERVPASFAYANTAFIKLNDPDYGYKYDSYAFDNNRG